jgi:hypothetical protein
MTDAQLKSLLAEITADVSCVAARPAATPRCTDAKPYHKQLQTVKLEKKDADAALVFVNVVCAVLEAWSPTSMNELRPSTPPCSSVVKLVTCSTQ